MYTSNITYPRYSYKQQYIFILVYRILYLFYCRRFCCCHYNILSNIIANFTQENGINSVMSRIHQYFNFNHSVFTQLLYCIYLVNNLTVYFYNHNPIITIIHVYKIKLVFCIFFFSLHHYILYFILITLISLYFSHY